MSDTQQGAGWWKASDGKWYPPETHPDYGERAPAAPGAAAVPGGGAGAEDPSAPVPDAPYPGTPVGGPPPTAMTPPPGHGYPAVGYSGVLPSARYSGLAIASLVLSILWLGGLGAILAIVFALIALGRISSSGGRLRGRGLSIAGLVIGIIGVLGAAALWSFVGWLGANARHVTVSVGQTVNVSDSFSLGIQTMTIAAVRQTDQVAGATATTGHFVVADVRVCAGPSGSKTGVFDVAFWLDVGGGHHVDGSGSARAVPDIAGRSLPSNSCRTGHVTFKVGPNQVPQSITYHGFVPSTYTWRLPAGF